MKVNKKLILMFILVLVIGVLSGCSKEIPEGFTKEFYKDIVETSNQIIKDIPNIRKEDVVNNTIIKFQSYSDFCDKYYSDYENGNLTITEEKAFKTLIGAVLGINTDFSLYYEKGDSFPSDSTLGKIKELTKILEIDINHKF